MKNYEQASTMSKDNPDCIHCDDTGVRLVHGEPQVCLCPVGQSPVGRKCYAEIMMKRKLIRKKEELDKTRIAPTLVVNYQCLKCHDTGFVTPDVPIGDLRYGRAEPCSCRAEARKKSQEAIFMKLCQLPDRGEWTLENYVARPGCEEMKKAALNIGNDKGLKWLTYLSESGYGKTHLLVGICRKWLDRGKSARYIFVPNLMLELKQGFDEQGMNSYASKMNFFKNVALLALDDLGTENSTPWVREQLDTIIDHRYVNKMPLVVTTNTPLDKLMPRVASRLKRIEIDGIGKTVVPSGVPYLDYLKKQGGK